MAIVSGRTSGNAAAAKVTPESSPPARPQLAQMFWLAVRAESVGDGVGVVVVWTVPSVWVVVP
jgi:hypothetical protein